MKNCKNKKCSNKATHSFKLKVVDPKKISTLEGEFCEQHIKSAWKEVKMLVSVFGDHLPAPNGKGEV